MPAATPVVSLLDGRAGEWDEYVAAHPRSTVDHLSGWRQVFEGVFGHRCAYLTAHRDNRLAGVLPLVLVRSRLFGRSAISVPFLNYGGVLADDGLVADALLAAARREAEAFGASHLELRHQARAFETLPCRQHKLGLLLDLPASPEAAWTALDRKVRNQVRKAQKEGLVVESGARELVDPFYAVFSRNMRDLGTPVYSRRLFEATLAAFPDLSRVFVVRQAGRPLAAAVAITFRGTTLVPWASSLREFRHLSPNMLLYWSMIEQAVAAGGRVFDFGRSSPGGGTHHFKLQWGAREVPLYWEYVLLGRDAVPDQGPSNPRFDMAIAAWKRLPGWLANSLGPGIARHLP